MHKLNNHHKSVINTIQELEFFSLIHVSVVFPVLLELVYSL